MNADTEPRVRLFGSQKQVRLVSDWLKKGELHRKHADIITSVFDSDKARFHDRLMRKAGPGEEQTIRVLLQVSCRLAVAKPAAPPTQPTL